MTEVAPNGTISWRMTEIERRFNAAQPEVTNVRVDAIEREIKIVKRLLWTLVFAVLGGSISMTVAMLTVLGQ